ncbi:TetR/AcrR family transcriptional regulator [Arsenicicoccus sp. oral taxon 190]|uniref:TetR/AcrR family transcriptional regulator n=1 Tax=Arsenicicoccus sp. oral taxon 190 TaxID=1658671 RepID=UPI00067A3C9F|nr:TetR family transcriptional regulator [Arsenicicoccus sp. oral taxon 190]AKT52827.1 hypothetical protein ADJ73_12435 [Arsenicicoccus sp. oral taxon 190]
MAGKGQRTRERIRAVALELVLDRGFDQVTVQEIATAAGVSHMTFFRHFPTKEDVVLSDGEDRAMAEAVARQPVQLAPLERARRGILQAWEALATEEPAVAAVRRQLQIVAGHPGLRARSWESNRATHQGIVAALVDGGAPPEVAEACAGACLGALTAALLARGPRGDDLGMVVVEALAVLAAPGEER